MEAERQWIGQRRCRNWSGADGPCIKHSKIDCGPLRVQMRSKQPAIVFALSAWARNKYMLLRDDVLAKGIDISRAGRQIAFHKLVEGECVGGGCA